MRYLQETFDKLFIKEETDPKTSETHSKHDGSIFEKIVEVLLEEMFPNLEWIPTQTTNDGNKDFWANYRGETYWAECKNYAASLELKVIAPTLVMAQLCNADEIFFFSVSPINSNTKKKICYYSQINQKKVHFICDQVLENLLLYFQSTRAFFSHVKNLPLVNDTSLLPEQYTLIMKNPFLNIVTDDQILGQPIDQIKLNEIITEQVYVINNDITNTLAFSINIDVQNEDLYCFEYLEEGDPSQIGKISEHFSIQPYEVFAKTYHFRVIAYKPQLQLPSLQIIYENVKDEAVHTAKQCVDCESIGRVPLVGSEYEQILTDFHKKLADKKRLFVFLCKGQSGVGKTRMLEETTALLIKNHYRMLNFVGLEEENSFSIIREIIFVLYNISDDMLKDMFFQRMPSDFQQTLPVDISSSIKLLYALYENKSSIKEFLAQYGDIVYEKLSCEKYAIIIDNLQYFDEGMLAFIEGIFLYSKNTNRKNSITLCVTINNDYLKDNIPANKLVHLLEKAEDSSFIQFYSTSITGFKEDAALLFLKQLLKLREETYDRYFYDLVKKANYNPYNIKHYADCISDNEKISSLVNNQRVIHDQIAFARVIDELPERLEQSLEERWQRMCLSFLHIYPYSNMEKIERSFFHVLSCLHIFRYLSYDGLVFLNCKRKYIKLLEDYHFIKCSSNDFVYTFDHDLIENYFEKIDSASLFGAVEYIKKKDLTDFEIDYPYVIHYISLCKFTDISTLRKDVEYGLDTELPYRMFLKYQQLSFKLVLKKQELFNDLGECFYYARRICITVRERLGGKYAHEFYKRILNFINKYPVHKLIDVVGFSEILFDIGENYHHMKEYNCVIKIYKKYLPAYEAKCRTHPNEVDLSVIAFIYNRLSIAYKHFSDDKSRKWRDDYINNAIVCSANLVNRQYHAESLYDKAEFYYNRIENKEQFETLCEQSCEEVDEYNIELMYLHNIQRKIRLNFVRGKRDQILDWINEGLDYIENGEYNDYRFFFSKFFHTARALHYLLNEEKYQEALQELFYSTRDTLSFGTTDIAYNQFLQAKIYFHLKEYPKSYEAYKASYLSIRNSMLNEKEFINEIVFDDIKLRANELRHFDFRFLSDTDYEALCQLLSMNDHEYEEYKENYHAKSIIRSDDGRENYPCI